MSKNETNRRGFVKTSAAVGLFLISPFKMFSKSKKDNNKIEVVIHPDAVKRTKRGTLNG